jgi:hypothetical protein
MRKSRSIIVLVCVLVVGLIAAATALAANYAGTGKDDPAMTVSFTKQNGKVKNFDVENLLHRCDGSSPDYRSGLTVPPMKIKDDGSFSFKGTLDDATYHYAAKITGQFHRHGKADGTVKETRTTRSSGEKCIGKEDWKASKQ